VHHHPQAAGRGDPRVLLAQAAGRRVARVGERVLALLDQGGVEIGEGLGREVDLAAHLQQIGGRPSPVSRSGISRMVRTLGGDVLTGVPVATGGAADQAALLVGQVDRQAVDLELAEELHRPARVPHRTLGPPGQLILVEDIVEREHALGVLHGVKVVEKVPPTFCVGESGVRSAGYSASMASSSRSSLSNSASEMVGASST
jgi:hypothetical protein